MQIAIISDTHIPDQAPGLPEEFRERIEGADRVIHAGDVGSRNALAEIQSLAKNLTSVYGNADPNDIDLPAVASLKAEGVTFVVTHGMVNHVAGAVYSSSGIVFDRDDWFDAITDTALARAGSNSGVVGVGGHTHQIEDEMHNDVRVLNPGSATGVGPADGVSSMMTVEVIEDELSVIVHKR